MNIIHVNDFCGWSLYDYWLYKDVYKNLLGALAYDASVSGITVKKLDAIDELYNYYNNALEYEYGYNLPDEIKFELDYDKALADNKYFLKEWKGPVINKVNITDMYVDDKDSNLNSCYYCMACEYKEFLDDTTIIQLPY